jgi:hypothetical protein
MTDDRKPDKNRPRNTPLKGYGHQQLGSPRGLIGSRFGPANKGRELLDPDEIKKIEEDLRKRGIIT